MSTGYLCSIFFIGEMFYENSSAIILVYDITRQDTLRACVQADSRIEALNTGKVLSYEGNMN